MIRLAMLVLGFALASGAVAGVPSSALQDKLDGKQAKQEKPPEEKKPEDKKGEENGKPEETVDEAARKQLRESLDGLLKANKEKSEVDVIHYAKSVGEKWKHGDKDMQEDAVEALAAAIKSKNVEVKSTVVEALGNTGGKASSVLLKEMSGEVAKKNVTYLCTCIRALSALKDEKAIDPLLKYLHNKSIDVIAATIAGTANYRESKLAVRKLLVEELLKIYAPLESAATKSGADTTDKNNLATLGQPFESSLQSLTGNDTPKGASAWDRWFRKEGKKAEQW